MSKYTIHETEFQDAACLLKALVKKGYTPEQIEIHDKATNLYGYQGDKRKDTAEIIIRRCYVGGASNDIGFQKQENGTYRAIISDFDRGRHNEKWMDSLMQEYTKFVTIDEGVAQGLIYQGETMVNGEFILQFEEITI